jgi:hypothetical protein
MSSQEELISCLLQLTDALARQLRFQSVSNKTILTVVQRKKLGRDHDSLETTTPKSGEPRRINRTHNVT